MASSRALARTTGDPPRQPPYRYSTSFPRAQATPSRRAPPAPPPPRAARAPPAAAPRGRSTFPHLGMSAFTCPFGAD